MSELLTGDEIIVYEGKIFEVVTREVEEQGVKKTFEFARRSPGVRLIIKNGAGSLLMSREYRHEIAGYDIRLPGGKVFDTREEYREYLKKKEDIRPYAEGAAKREAREEVGIVVKKLRHFATSKVGATVIWDLIYLVIEEFENLAEGQSLGNGEKIETTSVTFEDLEEMCLDGTIQEERSALEILRFLRDARGIQNKS